MGWMMGWMMGWVTGWVTGWRASGENECGIISCYGPFS